MIKADQKVAAIVPAAGMGTRMGAGISKQRMLLGGKTILAHAVERLCASGAVSECVVVVPVGELSLYQSLVRQLRNEDPAKDTIKVAGADGVVEATPDRSRLYLVQTPQVFRRDWLEQAHRLAAENQWDATDDSALIERLGHRVHLVKGSYFNLKITTPEDMVMAEAILAAISPTIGKSTANEQGGTV